MRLVIDLQACQHGSSQSNAALALAQQLARSANGHQVWITLDAGAPQRIESMRHAFAGLLPPTHIRAYDLPGSAEAAAGGDSDPLWQRRAAELVRENFLLGLAPDLVFTPAVGGRDANGALAVCSPAPVPGLLQAHALTSDALTPLPSDAGAIAVDAWQRLHTGLAAAELLLADNPAQLRRLQEEQAAPAQRLAVLDPDPAAAATHLWLLFDAVVTQAATAAEAAQAALVAPRRPRLAYLSPVPPEKSGIADYSADVLPALAKYYDIELVLEQEDTSDPMLAASFPLRSVAWFEAHADQFDRIVYHFGNNHMHRYMFGLLQRHPGVVILHDFYLSGVVDQMERGGYQDGAFYGALYQSHGYTGLQRQQRTNRNDTIWEFPTNKAVLDNAAGVIVHSDFARALAERWYGAGAADGWRQVALPRRAPEPLPDAAPAANPYAPVAKGKNKKNRQVEKSRTPEQLAHDQAVARRALARGRLQLDVGEFLVCTFGMLGATKLNIELLEAFLASPLAADQRCKLVFVGHNTPTEYGHEIEQRIAASGLAGRIVITGFVSAEQYADYGAATDIAVQLRSMTRGETSAAILDCLLHGAPTVINAHGAGAELPDNVVLKLPDDVSVAQLTSALTRLHGNPALRASLGAAAAHMVRTSHTPAASARGYHAAIEHFAQQHPKRHYRQLMDGLSRIGTRQAPGVPDLIGAARAIAFNQPPTAPRQLFVDVSALMDTDLKTGIQRVVRSVLKALIDTPPPGFRIEPVYGNGGNRSYRYARRFTLGMLGVTELALEDAPIEARHGDIFLGLDLFTNGTSQNRQLLLDMRRRGISVYFVVYDVLPMLRPDCFPHGTEEYFAEYLDTVMHASNGLLCISRAVCDDLSAWSENRPKPRRAPLQLGYFHLGADIDASSPSFGLPPNADHVFASVAARPSLLMVGTIEPRKGHAQALAAFDLLWEQGEQVNLVIVGKEGWMVDALMKRLKAHPQLEQHLFWLPGVSDEMLIRLYQQCAGLLAASEGEGFGLPLIEAAQHAIPILARDLPVFREVAQQHASYFTADNPSQLADAIRAWLAAQQAGTVPGSRELPWLTWAGSAQQLVDVIMQQKWYRELPGGSD